jgi:PR domain zinc finger protein 14
LNYFLNYFLNYLLNYLWWCFLFDKIFHFQVFDDGKLSHYVDGRTQNGVASWMSVVQCARCLPEQNMEVFQQDGEIYYQATRDIAPQTELLVWYGESYDSYLGIPTALKLAKKTTQAVEKLPEESKKQFCKGSTLRLLHFVR